MGPSRAGADGAAVSCRRGRGGAQQRTAAALGLGGVSGSGRGTVWAEAPPEGQRLTQKPFVWDLSVEGGPDDWVWPVCGSLSRLRLLGWSVNGWLQGLSRRCSWSPRSTGWWGQGRPVGGRAPGACAGPRARRVQAAASVWETHYCSLRPYG